MNEAALLQLLADTSDAVLDIAADGRVVYANPAAVRALGYQDGELHGLGMADLVAPEFLQLLNRTVGAVLESGQPSNSELQLCGKSGGRVWLRARFRRLDTPAGVVVRIVGQDLTELVSTEMRVRQIEEQFRAAFHAPADAVAINRASDGLYVEVNEGFIGASGYSREDLVGKTSLELDIWAYPHERDALVARLRKNGIVQSFECHFRKRTGEVELGMMSARLVTLNGEAHILSVTRDMTAWNTAQRALVEREANLAAALQLSRTLMAAIEQAAEDITITDPDGNIQYCNPSFQRITGYSGAEIIGRNSSVLKSGQHTGEFYGQMWTTIKSGRTWTGRFKNRRRDGALIVEDATISPILSEAGTLQGYVAVKRDVTEQLELEARFHQAQKLESVGRLAGGVAHDFNNLLTVVLGYGRMMAASETLPADLREQVEEIVRASERAAALTTQLLAFSRKQMIEPRPVDLSNTVAEAGRMLRRVLGDDIELHTGTTPGAVVMADPGQMHQVLMNLAVNARDAMPRGGKLSISVRNVEFGPTTRPAPAGLAAGPHVELSVADTGVGMDSETLEHVFEPFFTTKESGKGTGLGLATVYGIIRQSRGSVAIQSAPGAGTTVLIHLPRYQAAVAAGPEAGEAADLSGSATILVVEDQAEVRRFAVDSLRSYGYRVLEACDGASALEISRGFDGPIDLVFTDVVMPVMGGPELAERVKAQRPSAKILLTSGYWEAASNPQARSLPFLTKPYSSETLAAKVRALLGGATAP